jgi:hypothetical protein
MRQYRHASYAIKSDGIFDGINRQYMTKACRFSLIDRASIHVFARYVERMLGSASQPKASA